MNTDFSDTVQAKSDQMNAVDFISGQQTYTVISAQKTTDPKQPIAIQLDGHAQPYKPSLGYRRILTAVWGMDGSQWVGRKLTLDLDETVVYAGKEVGGICVIAMQGLTENKRFKLATSRGKFKFVTVIPIVIAFYGEETFAGKMPAVSGAIQNGKMTNEQAIMQLEKTAPLTDAQKQQVNKIELTPTVKETN
jgi:hypothetical protein